MNLRVLSGLLVGLSSASSSRACGPFFPDTVLDKPQSALHAPPVSYVGMLGAMAGIPISDCDGWQNRLTFAGQVKLEEGQLRAEWQSAGVAGDEIERRLNVYATVREALSVDLDHADLNRFPSAGKTAAGLAERPLGREYPDDVADYVEGARLLAIGKTEEARALWKSILEQPLPQRRLRGCWAAWMLAKTSTDLPECMGWYERVEKETASGAEDPLGLASASKSWRAPRVGDPIEAMKLFYEAFRGGQKDAAVNLRNQTRRLLADPDRLAQAAADLLVRKLVNLHLHATFDLDFSYSLTRYAALSEEGNPGPENRPRSFPEEWLKALETHASLPLEEGAGLAWALYAGGRYEEARHWLDLSVKSEPPAIWLQAKFDLRAGDLEAANRHLTEATHAWSNAPGWNPDHPFIHGLWYDEGRALMSDCQGTLLADAGVVALARKQYTAALDSLRRGGYAEDAAYVAEHVLTTKELLSYTATAAPVWEEMPQMSSDSDVEHGGHPIGAAVVDPATCLRPGVIEQDFQELSPNNRLRYELARRLAREGRLREAAPFMPPVFRPLFDHYRALERARISGHYSGRALAAILWRQAAIYRRWGAELFSTDSSPDGGLSEWAFEATDFEALRSHRGGWTVREPGDGGYRIEDSKTDGERAVPPVQADEVRRARAHAPPNSNRYHYRFVAAQLAWKAAKLLPDNDPSLAALYNTAGQWLIYCDEKAADRFYQAMVRRCGKTPAGQAADAKRWFPGNLEPLRELPGLPEELAK